MNARNDVERAPREAWCEHEWLRSSTGIPARITRTVERDSDGRKLYRLLFTGGICGDGRFTAEDLRASGARFLVCKPRDWKES